MGSTKPNLDFGVKEYDVVQPAANQVIAAAWADIAGWTLTIPRDGFYKIRVDGNFELDDTSSNGTAGVSFRLAVGGVGDGTTRKYFYMNGVNNGTDIQGGFEIEVYQNFSAGDVITLQGVVDTAGDSAQVFGTVTTRMARMFYELLNAYIPLGSASYNTGWIQCNSWANRHLGTVLDGNVVHGLDTDLANLIVHVLFNSVASDTGAFEGRNIQTDGNPGGNNPSGYLIQQVDTDNLIVQTSNGGVLYMDGSGNLAYIPSNWYYKVVVHKLI